jgi:hypothetical protein
VLCLALLAPAHAQMRGPTDAAPVFSEAERLVIGRNELLREAVGQEPWLVRRALDQLAEADRVQPRSELVPNSTGAGRSGRAAQPSENPDLERLERASPEAMNDLFQLLKQAGTRSRPAR